MKILRIVLFVIAGLVVSLAAVYFYLGHASDPGPPELSAAVREGRVRVGGLERTFTFFVPARRADPAPLVFVLHGSLQTVADIRTYTGYEFERLADAHGFIVVYPQGFKNNWNDCRKSAAYPARAQNIDDSSFFRRLTGDFVKRHGADAKRVFLAGYSNGGHFGFRLALERPESVAGIAAIAANLPVPENLDCTASGRPVSVLIMNGTEDPINPFAGGTVTLFGFGNRGTVHSSFSSAFYFARLAGYDDITARSQQGAVRLRQWRKNGSPEVALYAVQGGGHLIPQPIFRAPRLLGPTVPGFNGPEAIWEFFARQGRR